MTFPAKIRAAVLAGSLVLGLAACGDGDGGVGAYRDDGRGEALVDDPVFQIAPADGVEVPAPTLTRAGEAMASGAVPVDRHLAVTHVRAPQVDRRTAAERYLAELEALGWTRITVRCVPAGMDPELILVEASRFDGYRRDVKVELAGDTTAHIQAWATPSGEGDRPQDVPVDRGCLDDMGAAPAGR